MAKMERMLPMLFISSFILISGCRGGGDGDRNKHEAGCTGSSCEPGKNSAQMYIFDSTKQTDLEIQKKIDEIYQKQVFNEFGDERYALLFKKGTYHLDIKVGYNTQIAGLGKTPDDVKIIGAVRTQDGPFTYARYKKATGQNPTDSDIRSHVGALNNFWRSVENISIELSPAAGFKDNGVDCQNPDFSNLCGLINSNVWAVSQASPMRRVHLFSHLSLSAYGWASGGFMANVKVDGVKNDWAGGGDKTAENVSVSTGSQQQWFSRNIDLKGAWYGGNWNMFFMGVPATDPHNIEKTQFTVKTFNGTSGTNDYPPKTLKFPAFTLIQTTPRVAEKPFLIWDDKINDYAVYIPPYSQETRGVEWNNLTGETIPIKSLFFADNTMTSSDINKALADSAIRGVIFKPGVYKLDKALHVTQPNTVLLGLGLPDLSATGTESILKVDDVNGVRVAGLLFDGGPNSKETDLIVVGGPNVTSIRHQENPTILYDIFCRVGGRSNYVGTAKSCMQINSNDVIGDNFWLWRADHGNGVSWTSNTADTGLTVNGNRVTIYSLAVEHFQKYQTEWNGDDGQVYFYQSEMPYDAPAIGWGPNLGPDQPSTGYAAYHVNKNVYTHHAYGLGVYSFFKDNVINATQAIQVDSTSSAVVFSHMATSWLNGYFNKNDADHVCTTVSQTSATGIKSIINGQGKPVSGCYTNADVDPDLNLPGDVNGDYQGTIARQSYLQTWSPGSASK